MTNDVVYYLTPTMFQGVILPRLFALQTGPPESTLKDSYPKWLTSHHSYYYVGPPNRFGIKTREKNKEERYNPETFVSKRLNPTHYNYVFAILLSGQKGIITDLFGEYINSKHYIYSNQAFQFETTDPGALWYMIYDYEDKKVRICYTFDHIRVDANGNKIGLGLNL